MTQKLNKHQLQHSDIASSTEPKSFSKRKNQPSSKSSFSHNQVVSFERFNDSDLKRYENLFNTYVHQSAASMAIHASKEQKLEASRRIARPRSEEKSQISQLEKDLRKQSETLEIKTTVIDEEPDPNECLSVDDDLMYLETLLNTGINVDRSNSLSDLFAEIVDNEKEPISNYESSIFDANIQMLFDEGAIETDSALVSDLSSSAEMSAPNLELPSESTSDEEPPTLHIEPSSVSETVPVNIDELSSEIASNEKTPIPHIELPPIPELPTLEPSIPELVNPQQAEVGGTANSTAPLTPEAFANSFIENGTIESSFEDVTLKENIVLKKKKKRLKLGLIDTMLIIIILTILVIFVVFYGDRLPFNLPF